MTHHLLGTFKPLKFNKIILLAHPERNEKQPDPLLEQKVIIE